MTTTKFTPKFGNTAELGKAIESIARRGLKLDADIQDAALSCLHRIAEHGDVGYLNRLFLSMPKGSRSNALAFWAGKYGKVKINLDKASNKELPFIFWKEGNTDYEGAIAEPWFKCKPEKDLDVEFDFLGKLEALLKYAKGQVEAGKPIKGLDKYLEMTGGKSPTTVQVVPMALPDEVVVE